MLLFFFNYAFHGSFQQHLHLAISQGKGIAKLKGILPHLSNCSSVWGNIVPSHNWLCDILIQPNLIARYRHSVSPRKNKISSWSENKHRVITGKCFNFFENIVLGGFLLWNRNRWTIRATLTLDQQWFDFCESDIWKWSSPCLRYLLSRISNRLLCV